MIEIEDKNDYLVNCDLTTITRRVIDNSYVVIRNGMPYHVPNTDDYKDFYIQLDEYVKKNPEVIVEEYPYIPSTEEQEVALIEYYTVVIQKILDDEAKCLGYDSCLSVCSYVDSGVQKFDDEGRCFRKWRSAVWNTGYEILDKVKAREMEVPTEEELINLLPKLEIIYS